MPARYQQDTTGRWRCPPGESYAEQVGLTYQVRSSAEYHPLFIQNLKFLQDYWAHPTPIDASQEAQPAQSEKPKLKPPKGRAEAQKRWGRRTFSPRMLAQGDYAKNELHPKEREWLTNI